jgi:hypothetical protein
MRKRSYLEVDDYTKDNDGCHQVGQVGQVLTVESLPQSSNLVLSSGQQVEEGNDCALELCSASGVDGCGREGLPNDRLADVSCNEERNSRAQTVTLLKKLIKLKL